MTSGVGKTHTSTKFTAKKTKRGILSQGKKKSWLLSVIERKIPFKWKKKTGRTRIRKEEGNGYLPQGTGQTNRNGGKENTWGPDKTLQRARIRKDSFA